MMRESQLVRDLYSLEEPWRTRFLVLIANLATKQGWHGGVPNPNQVAFWLEADTDLERQMAQMLQEWVK